MNIYSPVVSGSLTVTGSATIIGNLTITSGSLISTASNAMALNGTGSLAFVTTASYNPTSASFSSVLTSVSSSNQQLSASYIALSGSYNTFSGSNSTILTSVSSSNQQLSASYIALSGSYNTFSGSASTRITVDSASLQQVSSSQQQISASYTALSGSYNVFSGSASTRVSQIETVYATTGSNSFRANQSITGSLVVSSTITAQTLIVQTVTSSIVYSSGSNIFGSQLTDRQTFTGSVNITGSLALAGNITGNAITLTGALSGTSATFSGTNALDVLGSIRTDGASNGINLRNGYTATISNPNNNTRDIRFDQDTTGTVMFKANGNVGIGTTSPNAKVTIWTPSTTGLQTALRLNNPFGFANQNTGAQIVFSQDRSTAEDLQQGIIAVGQQDAGTSATSYMSFSTNNTGLTEKMRITSGGNVGISVTPANWLTATVAPLQIRNSSFAGYSISGVHITYVGSNWYYDTTGVDKYISNGYASIFSQANGAFEFITAPSGTAGNNITFTTSMKVTSGGNLGIGTTSPTAKLEVIGATSNVNGYGDGSIQVTGTSPIAFVAPSNLNPSLNRWGFRLREVADGDFSIYDYTNSVNRLMIKSGGNVHLGKGWGASNHRINLEVAQGNTILVVSAYSGSSNDTALFYGASGANPSASGTAFGITTNSSTGRSISAGGTINASGADYAEYMFKAITDSIAKGDIVGVNIDGKLTNIFNDAISFVVKSTDPSYVGGDVWGNEDALGEKRPQKVETQTEEEFASIMEDFETRLEVERQKVDRIAFSGQVPVNVTGAIVGDYIIPITTEDGKITGQAITNPSFDQYKLSVGKVWKIMEDGRAWIAVKIG